MLELTGIAKSYPGVRALAGVDLAVRAGEVRGLLGQNGAGKSTLMKVIAGAESPDSGTMHVAGEPVPFGSPFAARSHGIGIVYQELSLIPTMSIGENVLLGRWPGSAVSTSASRAERAAREHLERVGITSDPSTPAEQLGVAERQLVEIAKALSAELKVLLLDEPTSALSDPEARRLFDVVHSLTADGVAVVYVSHRLPEVLQICDTVTVLRDGERVGDREIAEVDEADLARLMVGESVMLADRAPDGGGHAASADVALRATGLARPPRLKPVDLEVWTGEVVAIFGLVGAGRTRLASTLFGLEPATEGTLELFGRPLRLTGPRQAIEAGVGYVGEDRAAGLVSQMTIAQNVVLASLRRLGSALAYSRSDERHLGERYVDELAIRTPSADRVVSSLSGGNQQKVVLARWLCSGARLLLLDDPVRGVDVGAKEEVYRLVRDLARTGVTVLYLTSELREARALGDRLLVMADGAITAELPPTASEDDIMTAAGGVRV